MAEPTPQDLVRARGSCSSCGARVFWATTTTGKRMPVNTDPSAVGNVQLFMGYDANEQRPYVAASVLHRNQIPGARAAGQTLRTAHFRDCPDANRHRRRTHR